MTIKDLAAKTGYAVGTVSRALNNQPNVSREARDAILNAAREMGFQINENARRLKQHQSNTILVMVKGNANELFGAMVETIQAMIASSPYQLAVDYSDEDDNQVARAVDLCRERKPVGILFLGGSNQNFLSDFGSIDVPCVVITHDASQLHFRNLSSVSTDDAQAAKAAIDLLISLGHSRIAIIGGDRATSDTSRLRYEGCMLSFREHSIPFDPNRDFQGVRYSYRDGYQAVQTLLENGCRFTAIFAHADVMAIGAIRALWDHGLRVPEDISVMGVDELPLDNFLVPKLATVKQNTARLASRGVELLLDAIENGAPAVHETVPFCLLRKESIRDIRKQGENKTCVQAAF